ncbi:NAD-dependent epimerase/dehydratase family protein [Conexibacter sp. CPCC 205706]|uniref:NAD-dependent epimerase/dehydratase family protein n=1 Tax=Conexibacter sp. CPCC 205706 TaxID=3064572 RepID=UPI00271952B6|nr:NAD-dependent epimerase/dehydratase family protein [Conexibacter sp. CPCC 205706]MDO8188176.1 NAD-dependent epimerase/dehydratase family protein [Conexibacter sp. CPCC 205706]
MTAAAPLDLLVMGGTRFMGRAVVERALARGHRVTIVHRGSHRSDFDSPVTEVLGDRSDPATLSALRALGDRFDAVVDLSAYGAEQTRALCAALPDVPRFVHVSTGAVYAPQPTFPWPESSPLGPAPLWGGYAREKLACEAALRELRGERGVTWALRLPYVLGPRNYAPREEFVLNRLLDGAELLLPGGGAALIQFADVTQVGPACIALAERPPAPALAPAAPADAAPADAAPADAAPAASGFQPLNVATTELVSLAGFVALCAEVARTPVRTRPVGGGPTGTGNDVFDAADCVFPFPNDSYVLDVARLAALGLDLPEVSVREMIARALTALRADPERRRWRRTEAEKTWL